MSDTQPSFDETTPDTFEERSEGSQSGTGRPNEERPTTPPVQDRVESTTESGHDEGETLPPSPDQV